LHVVAEHVVVAEQPYVVAASSELDVLDSFHSAVGQGDQLDHLD
jgi:hypothetical protein